MDFIPVDAGMMFRPYDDDINVAFCKTRKECKYKVGANKGEIYCAYDLNTKDRFFFCLGAFGEEFEIYKKYSFCVVWKEVKK